MTDVQGLRQKLEYLRETVDFNKNLEVFSDANGNADLFDVVTHRYHLGPCLTEAELTAVEDRHNITFPKAYRAFLLEIGNGGAGPYYGLYTLAKGAERRMKDAVARPFLLTSPYVRPEHAGEAAVTAFLQVVNRPEHVHGTLPIADFGCGIDVLLVIMGEARGTLWLDDRHSDNGVWPLCVVDGKVDGHAGFSAGFYGENSAGLQLCDFFAWYDAWLDERMDIHARYKRGEWKAPWTEARRNLRNAP